MVKKGQLPGHPMQINFVLGVPGCTAATIPNLCRLVNSIPSNAPWTSTGVGRAEFPMAAAAIAMGGHVRVGFEDNVYLEKGVLAKSNGELVAKVVRIAKELGREIATPAEARKILSL
jgi:3-keto-5-aminohexanoate cleavage enzyme